MQQSKIIAVFDYYHTAQAAARELMDDGIPREDVQLQSNFATGAAGGAVEETFPNQHREGGIRGFFHRLFGGHDDYAHYEEAVRRGSTVVVVTAPPELMDRAVEILNQHGAVDIDRRVTSYREAGWREYDPNAPAYSAEEAERERERYQATGEGQTIPVVQEELEIGKRVVRRGGVRIYTEVVEEPVEEQVDLQEETNNLCLFVITGYSL